MSTNDDGGMEASGKVDFVMRERRGEQCEVEESGRTELAARTTSVVNDRGEGVECDGQEAKCMEG